MEAASLPITFLAVCFGLVQSMKAVVYNAEYVQMLLCVKGGIREGGGKKDGGREEGFRERM